ncbi:MAG: hypothetical protein ABR570_07055 [Burkholderiales bacterium]
MYEVTRRRQPVADGTRPSAGLRAPIYSFAGPPGMAMAVQGMLGELGVAEDDMRTEEFYGY